MKYLSLFALLFACKLLYAQSNYPLPTRNVSWVDKYDYSILPGPNYCAYDQFTVSKDTFINNVLYHKLKKIKYDSPSCQMGTFTSYPAVDTGFFRNDSINKKVYYKSSANANEQLMYDFDIQLNDLYPSTFLVDPNIVLKVDSIDRPFADSSRRRIFMVDTLRPLYFLPKGIIDGVGGSGGFLGVIKNNLSISSGRVLYSFCHNNFDLLGNPCSILTSANFRHYDGLSKTKIYYDYINNLLKVESISKGRFQLYDLNGRLLVDQLDAEAEIPIYLKAGMYIGLFTKKNGSINKSKILVK